MTNPAHPSTAAPEACSSSSSSCPPPSPPPPTVHGLDVTPTLQCRHWHSERDVIAIRHRCCGRYYACISCHEALAGHAAEVWPRGDPGRAARAVLCGRCRREMTVGEYLGCGSACPGCGAAFNPGCALHYELYFEM